MIMIRSRPTTLFGVFKAHKGCDEFTTYHFFCCLSGKGTSALCSTPESRPASSVAG